MKPEIKERIEQIKRGQVPEGYKKTKVGIVPNEWEEIKFDSIFIEYSEFTSRLEQYPLYSLTIEEGIVEKTERYERSHLVKKENSYKILPANYYAYNPMNVRFGAVSRNKCEKDVSVSGYYDIFTTKEKTDLKFMDSFLVSKKMIAYYNKVSTGSLVEKQRVHFSQFMNFILPLPNQNERKKIADILSTQDKIIELKEKLIDEKQKQKKYLMQMLLTGKKRLKGFDGEWKKVKLGNYLKESKEVARADISKRITVKLNMRGVIKRVNNSSEKEDATTQYTRRAGQFIYGKQNLHKGAFGIVPDELDGYQSSSDIPSFYISKSVNPLWIYYWFARENYYKNLEVIATGTGSKRIQTDSFLSINIMYPPLEEQIAIANILSTQDKEIELLQQDLEQEKQKKKALMQLLLTGIVRV